MAAVAAAGCAVCLHADRSRAAEPLAAAAPVQAAAEPGAGAACAAAAAPVAARAALAGPPATEGGATGRWTQPAAAVAGAAVELAGVSSES